MRPPVDPAKSARSIRDTAAGLLHSMFVEPVQDIYQYATTTQPGESEAGRARDAAMMGVAGLLVPGAAKGAKAVTSATKGIRAYHGSPHDFDRFDISRIGTGEGAQAYGHGLYFADKESVARSYRDNLSPPKIANIPDDLQRRLGEAWDQLNRQNVAAPTAQDAADMVVKRLEQQKKDAARAGDFDWWTKAEDQISYLRRLPPDAVQPTGKMYEVNINARPEQFLDWDKPLSGQPGAVAPLVDQMRSAGYMAERRLGGDPRGEEIYSALGTPSVRRALTGSPEGFSDKAKSTDILREAGIPGIKYLDQGSRAAGEGSSNYVVFDDSLIDILRKYGLLAPTAGLGAAAATGDGT